MLDTVVGAGPKDDPADVARDGFEAPMAGTERVVSASESSKLQGRAGLLLPDSAKARMREVMAKPRSGDPSPKGLLAAAPGDRRIQAAAAIMLGLMSAVWAGKARR